MNFISKIGNDISSNNLVTVSQALQSTDLLMLSYSFPVNVISTTGLKTVSKEVSYANVVVKPKNVVEVDRS